MSDISDNSDMTRVCRVKLEEKDLKEISGQFSRLVSSLTKSSEIEHFFDQFLTKEEKVMLTKRLVLFMMIKKKYSTSDIWSALHITRETARVYRGKLIEKSNLFHTIIDKLIQEKEAKEFFGKVEKLLEPLGLLLRAKGSIRARNKLFSDD